MKTVTPLDQETWNAAINTMAAAKKANQDPIEALHRAGLITTVGERRAIRARAVKYVHDLVQTWTPQDFLARRWPRGGSATPVDMYNEIVDFLREVYEKVQTEDEYL